MKRSRILPLQPAQPRGFSLDWRDTRDTPGGMEREREGEGARERGRERDIKGHDTILFAKVEKKKEKPQSENKEKNKTTTTPKSSYWSQRAETSAPLLTTAKRAERKQAMSRLFPASGGKQRLRALILLDQPTLRGRGVLQPLGGGSAHMSRTK
ncbi:hypothetical protein EYF80_012564 [Liparis tanakae]|uniref:Uncharacterized protein n=1 Tax=Liparis tanakae TaxID=230148 RepID=A0A4Z2IHI2_9TELE|nr:hypothetical protein EYF80_012564 [Liparis tanakae]